MFQKPVGGVAVMPLGADLLSKFRKDKPKEDTGKQPIGSPKEVESKTKVRFK